METDGQRKKGGFNASRVLEALGRIGYDPVDALMDITDNSLSAGAEHISIDIEIKKMGTEGPGRPKAVISGFSVADDGCGMDEEKLDNALALGSSDEYYSEGTLSKFGMGLKSAASSLGRRLEVLTREEEESTLLKAVLDRDEIEEAGGDYVYDLVEPAESEVDEFNEYCGEGSGTIINIRKPRLESLPSASEIESGLQNRAGVVYHYFLDGHVEEHSNLTITVNGEDIDPLDPVFEYEAEGNLNENEWDGISVKWITRPQDIQLDPEGKATAELRITQLPHPPSVKDAKEISKAECRRNYMIGAGNYGFYIYRNYRLISWADSLDMVSQSLQHYGFRGRLMIDKSADDLLNIDVTKSQIQLSEVARSQLLPIVRDALKKSRNAWEHRTEELKKKTGEDPHEDANEEIDKAADIVERDDKHDEEVASEEEREDLASRRQKAESSKPADEEEQQNLRDKSERVQYVDHLDNNQLWERAYDPEEGLIVRVNRRHRFFVEVLNNFTENDTLVKVMDTVFFALARGEYSFLYKGSMDYDKSETAMQEYRERVGSQMSELIRIMNTDVFGDSE